jgi:glycosyltransferase involved in cell wall biosynthesis
VFVLPTSATDQRGPNGGWISTAGWAAAAERVLGHAWIATSRGVLTAEEVRRSAAAETSPAPNGRRVRRALPTVVKTAAKDVRQWRRARHFEVPPSGPWSDAEVCFVWQRHDLFYEAGLDLAARLRVPSVLFVPALIVRQAEQWGVRRRGWGRPLERRAEVSSLRRAALVACGSDLVAADVVRLGVDEQRILVTPTGVDLALFEDAPDRDVARRALGLRDEFVVGWSGSFRAFHALDQLVDAAARLGPVTLLLVGDGPERPRIQALADERGVDARFTGMVSHHRVPALLAAMDAGVVLGRADEPFHYSPLKLAEYLAAGLPTVAPAAPHLMAQLDDRHGVSFFVAGDVTTLAARLAELRDDPAGRARRGQRARAGASAWSWDAQIVEVCTALERI